MFFYYLALSAFGVAFLLFGLGLIQRFRKRSNWGIRLYSGWFRDFRFAAAIGFGLIAILWLAGLAGPIAARYASPGLDLFRPLAFLLGAALLEECIFRAGVIQGLAFVRCPKPAWIPIATLISAAAHIANRGVTPIGIAGHVIGAATYSWLYLRTGGVWAGTGLHAAWNIMQGPILGLAVSGRSLGPSLFRSSLDAPAWIGGGAYGIEGGVISIAIRFVILYLLYRRFSQPAGPRLQARAAGPA